MIERLRDYHGKIQILRQIMSNKARVNRRVNTLANVVTVVVSSSLTFMGFAGLEDIQMYVNLVAPVEIETVGLVFNLLVLALFILVILHLVFRFSERQAEAERAVVSLTHLLNRTDDMMEEVVQGFSLGPAKVENVRNQYDILIQAIPANSDREFIRAKKDFQIKQLKKASVEMSAQGLFDRSNQERVLKGIILQSAITVEILKSLRSIDTDLFLGGGLIRNAVWDYLHGYDKPTPIDDVDVIYFDSVLRQKEADSVLEEKLKLKIPNLRWSVKNQARMHEINADDPYTSLIDAVSKWPETATALVVRLSEAGDLDVIAPYGYSDLFRLVVRPTPCFLEKLERFRRRVEIKNWQKTWPRLLIIEK